MTPAKILVVDDEPVQRYVLRAYLEEAGYQVETARSALDALARAHDSRPDVILSDVMMDTVDGFDLSRRVRDDAALGDIPVVLMSAHFGRESVGRAKLAGAATLVERTGSVTAELAAVRDCLADVARRAAADTSDGALRASALRIAELADQVRVADSRYRALLDSANDGISIVAPDGRILEANRRWEEILGISPEELVGMHVDDFAAPEDADANALAFRESVEKGSHRVVVPLRRRDTGAKVHMALSTRIVELDGHVQMFVVGRDVTAEVNAKRMLAEAAEMYRSLIERIPDVVWRARLDGSYLFLSPNVAQITGYTAEELTAAGRALWLDRIHADDRASVTALDAQVLADGKACDMEYRFRAKDGRWLWLRSWIAIAGVGPERVIEGLTRDMTKKRLLEQSFAQAQKLEAIGQLAGGIAHDFNNVLAVILGNVSFLIEALPIGDPRRDDAEEIEHATQRAAALTRQLLAFTRRDVVQAGVVDINAVVTNLGKMLRRLIGEDIALDVHVDEHLGAVRADVGQLEQVIMNLTVNARDAMPRGGTVTIETANVDLGEGEASGLPAGRYVMFSVSDTGTGMDSETRSHLFEPFFTTKERGKGTGLGLPTCYGIVQQARGHIWVYSELGQGSVFKVLLPRTDAVAADTKPAETATPRGTETVLLVEDDAKVRVVVQRMLLDQGYQVMAAGDGAEALALVEGGAIAVNLIISDVVMPGPRGPEVIERLLRLTPGARVLLMSGHTDHTLRRSGILEARGHFLQKPFAPDALARKVRAILDT